MNFTIPLFAGIAIIINTIALFFSCTGRVIKTIFIYSTGKKAVQCPLINYKHPQANQYRKRHAPHLLPCTHSPSTLLATNLSLHKVQRLFLGHDINTTGLVNITNTIALFRHEQHFRSERRANELSLFGTFGQHLGNGGTVLGIEVCVDFVKEVEGCWI
jgi:hypothetical protein